jgi:hypothetical protein
MNNYGLVVKNTKKTGSVGWNMKQEDEGGVTGMMSRGRII